MIAVLDNIRSAQNVGSILRTCDAFRIKKVILCGITPGVENPKVKKTSLDAERNLEVSEEKSTLTVVNKLKKDGNQLIALELTDNATPLSQVEVKGEVALVIGNEVSGVSTEVIAICDSVTMIPMQGIKESLNVAVAFGIAAYVLSSKKKTCEAVIRVVR
jgi:23S rRNA (guanosine2251-2'-O)-methyltransferase